MEETEDPLNTAEEPALLNDLERQRKSNDESLNRKINFSLQSHGCIMDIKIGFEGPCLGSRKIVKP